MSSIALEVAETSSELAKFAALYPNPSFTAGGSSGAGEKLKEKVELERWIGLVAKDLDPVSLMEMGYRRCMKAAAMEVSSTLLLSVQRVVSRMIVADGSRGPSRRVEGI
jgi:hypothetical protein